MQYHNYRFGFKGNIKVLVCKLLGHRLNDDASSAWCGRCNLAYSECYYPQNYAEASGIIDVNRYDESGCLKCSECRERERSALPEQ